MQTLMVLALLLTPLCTLAENKPTRILRYGINAHHAMPLIDVERTHGTPKIKGGLLFDLGQALFNEMKLDSNWILIPKSRIASNLSTGNLHMICHINEVWQPNITETAWSQEVYSTSNVVVWMTAPPVQNIKDLYGKRIGTVLNFIYPVMTNSFKKSIILREDGPNNESNIQKLLKGRIEYALLSNFEFKHYKKSHPTLASADLAITPMSTKCALSHHAPITIKELNQAIDAIKKNGTLEKILKSYN